MGKRRYSREKQQEDVSRAQVKECFSARGWPADDISTDVGEDLFVRIFDEGVSSGITFSVQLKSVSRITNFLISKHRISYSVKVAHLHHWQNSISPVVLIVWDIRKKVGYWITVKVALQELSTRVAHWCDQKSVSIHLPLENATDDAGLERLRGQLANIVYPIIACDTPLFLTPTFVFPPSAKGNAEHADLLRHFTSGESVKISGDFVQNIGLSEWWTRLYGKGIGKVKHIKMVSRPSDKLFPVKVTVLSNVRKSASLDYVELGVEKQGSEEAMLSNVKQKFPMRVRLLVPRKGNRGKITVSITGPGSRIEDNRQVLKFLEVLSQGGTLTIKFLKSGEAIRGPVEKDCVNAPNLELVDLVEKLCFIKEHTGECVSLRADGRDRNGDMDRVEKVVAVIREGRLLHESECDFSFTIDRSTALKLAHAYKGEDEFTLSCPTSELPLFESAIPLGPVRYIMKATLDEPVETLERRANQTPDGEIVKISFHATGFLAEYENWPRD